MTIFISAGLNPDQEYLKYRRTVLRENDPLGRLQAIIDAEDAAREQERAAALPRTLQGKPRTAPSTFLGENILEPFLYEPAKYLNLGMAEFSEWMHNIGRGIHRMTGIPLDAVTQGWKQTYLDNAEYWDEKIATEGLTDRLLGQFIGGMVPAIAKFFPHPAGIALHGLAGYGEEGAKGAAKGAAERYGLGKLLALSQSLPLVRRIMAMAGIGAAQHKLAGGKILSPAGAEAAAGMGALGVLGGLKGQPVEDIFGPEKTLIDRVLRTKPASRLRPSPAKENYRDQDRIQGRKTVAPETPIVPPIKFDKEREEEVKRSFFEQVQPAETAGERQTLDLLGGPSGAGKTQALEGLDLANTIVAGPDAVKERAGYESRAPAFHEISSRVSKEIADTAVDSGYNLVYDSYLANYSLSDRLIRKTLAKGGQAAVDFINTDFETSAARTMARPLSGETQRIVPSSAVIDSYNRALPAFLELLAKYRGNKNVDFYLYDNSKDFQTKTLVLQQSDGIFKIEDEQTANRLLATGYKRMEGGKGHVYFTRSEGETQQTYQQKEPQIIQRAATLVNQKRHSQRPGSATPEGKTPEDRLPLEGTALVLRGSPGVVHHADGDSAVYYGAVDVHALIPSHNPLEHFTRDPRAPKGGQERQYQADKREQYGTFKIARRLQPDHMISSDSTPIGGPPVIDGRGAVLGGNKRAMALLLAYDMYPDEAVKYKNYLVKNAAIFGLDPAGVADMKTPVLVRILADPLNEADWPRMSRIFNQSFTQGLDPMAEAVSRGRMVSQETLDKLSAGLERFDTLRQFMASPKSRDMVNSLVSDGAIEAGKISSFTNAKTGLLNERGRLLVENTLRGKIIDDYDLLDSMKDRARAVLQKIDKALPYLSRLKAHPDPGWDVSGPLKGALHGWLQFSSSAYDAPRDFLRQQSMIDAPLSDPAAEALFLALDKKPTEFRALVKELSAAASADIPGQAALPGMEPESPAEAFARVFTQDQPETAVASPQSWYEETVRDYEKRYGSPPSAYSAMAADAIPPDASGTALDGRLFVNNPYGENWLEKQGDTVRVLYNEDDALKRYPETLYMASVRRGAAVEHDPEKQEITVSSPDLWISAPHGATPIYRRQQQNLFTKQLSLFTKPRPKGSGPRTVSIKNKLPSSGGVITLAKATADIVYNKGHINLRGQRVKTAEDIAVLAQPFRDTRFETFRIIYLDQQDNVLDYTAVTSQHASAVRLPPSLLQDIRSHMNAIPGAARFAIVHNHPSGIAHLSQVDISLSDGIRKTFPDEYVGHVVIDSGHFAKYMAGDAAPANFIPLPNLPPNWQDPLFIPSVNHPILKMKIASPNALAVFASTFFKKGDPLVFFITSNLKVRAVKEAPLPLLTAPNAAKWLRDQANSLGGPDVMIYTSTMSDLAAIRPLVANSDIIDAITLTSPAQPRLAGEGLPGDINRRRRLARNKNVPVAFRVAEPAASYIPDKDNLSRPLVEFVNKAEGELTRFLDQEPPVELPFSININHAKIDAPERIHEVIRAIAAAFPEEIHGARRGTVSNEATRELADKLGMTPALLRTRQYGQAFNAHEIYASIWLMLDSANGLNRLRDRVLSGDATDRDKFQFLAAFKQHVAIQEHVSGAIAEAGRSLQIMKAVKGLHKGKVDLNIEELMAAAGTPEAAVELAQKMKGLRTVTGVNVTTRQLNRATAFDMLFEAWINGLLSNPTTHVVNLVGSAAAMFYSIPERLVAGGLGGPVAPGEAGAMLRGAIEGFKDALALGSRALRTGETSDAFIKEASLRRRAITARNLGLERAAIFGWPIGKAIDFIADYVIRAPGRALMAGDEFMKAIAYRMELKAQAYRKAYDEGYRDEQLTETIMRYENDPDTALAASAVKFAREMTWTAAPGPAGRAIDRMARTVPGLRYIMPFRRTPMNIAKFIGRRTPLAPLSADIMAQIRRGGAERDLALARIALGTLTMVTVAELVSEGVVTGGGPVNTQMRKFKRDQGWQPYSVRIGNQYISYSRVDPLGGIIGLGADMAEILSQLDDLSAEKLASAAVISISKNVTSKTYLRGVSELINAINDPERYGPNYIRRFAGTFSPAYSLSRAIERQADPTVRYVNNLMDEYKANLPGYSKSLPPRMNIWGEPVVYEVGWYDLVNPFYHSRAKNEPVSREILDARIPVGMPAKRIMGVRLEPFEYARYVELAGKEIRINGLSLKDALRDLMKTPLYRGREDGPDGGKALLVKRIIYRYRRAARERLLEEKPLLRAAVEQAERKRLGFGG